MIKFNDYKKEVKARGQEYLKAVSRVLDSGWYILGTEVEDFEGKFAKYLGAKYCVGVGNGLEALQISLMALGVGNGDEVITTPISAVATTLAIVAVGAKPAFVDVNENGQIDASKIERVITKKTKAIIPVDLYGQPCKLDEIRKICRIHKLYMIEDAAQAHGSMYKGKMLGTYGDIGAFSFYPTKNLGAFGDGGAIVTNSKRLADASRKLRDYGQESKYRHTVYGLNSRLDELHAAVLTQKLKYLDKDNRVRRKLAARYIRNLKNIKGIGIVVPKTLNDSNFHLFVVKTGKRDELKAYLAKYEIPTLIHYPSVIPDQPLFAGKYRSLEVPFAREFVKQILSLPCHPFMSLSEVDYISSKIKYFLTSND